MSPEIPDTRQLVRLLIEREGDGSNSAEAAAVAVHKACERLYVDLCKWVGTEGCYVLFTRAVRDARDDHPVLDTVDIDRKQGRHLRRTADIQKYGAAATAEGLEALLVAVVELLSRLVGEDIAVKLVQHTSERSSPEDTAPDKGEDIS